MQWPKQSPLLGCHPHHLSGQQSLPSKHLDNNKTIICDMKPKQGFYGNQGRFPYAGVSYRRLKTSPRYMEMRRSLMECDTRATSLKNCRSLSRF